MSYDRATFQQLAELRLAEAKLLLENGLPFGAYYLAGYAVECALKSIIATGFRANEIPDKSLVNSVYTHNLNELVNLAGLRRPLQDDMSLDADLKASWTTVSNWSEHARYETWTAEAAALFWKRLERLTKDCCNGYRSAKRSEDRRLRRTDPGVDATGKPSTGCILGVPGRAGWVETGACAHCG
jgi:HEPN domain-containing protein